MIPLNSKTASMLAVLALANLALAQRSTRPSSAVASPEVKAYPHVTFRIHAPKAEAVSLTCHDMPGDSAARTLKKGDNGVWELTVGPVDPGTYRYLFDLDGVPTVDPRNQDVSESKGNIWSVLHVPGSDFMDRTEAPHGSVARVFYQSTALGKDRRMHVYTPPGYEAGAEKYTVFYLLHGAGDCDDTWISVGRANFILDNLIAAKKAKPMIVVMPAGHTGPFSYMPRKERPKEGNSTTAKEQPKTHCGNWWREVTGQARPCDGEDGGQKRGRWSARGMRALPSRRTPGQNLAPRTGHDEIAHQITQPKRAQPKFFEPNQ